MNFEPYIEGPSLDPIDVWCRRFSLFALVVLCMWWTFPSTIPVRFGRALILLFGLGGCVSYSQPFVSQPGVFSCVEVHWTARENIQAYCPRGATACATVGGSPGQIWARKPEAFDDFEAVYELGHEFLHSLGARHK